MESVLSVKEFILVMDIVNGEVKFRCWRERVESKVKKEKEGSRMTSQ